MSTAHQRLLLARYGSELRPNLDESVARMIKNKVLHEGDHFYCAEEMTGLINVWSGKGRQPQWIKEVLTKGVSLDELRATA
jgi:DNA-binding protein H-NS